MKKFPYIFNNHLETPDCYRGVLLNKSRLNLSMYLMTDGDINARSCELQGFRDVLNKSEKKIIPDTHRTRQKITAEWVKRVLESTREWDE